MTGRRARHGTARGRVHGDWLDWKARRLTAPPAELLQAFAGPRDTAEVAELPPISTTPTAAPA